ncbi:resolvase [filamentous cyanobacterium LEGE 11480]|uniref:Resolvase n=2 Tax=Romeriopsis TaxID=2992131 RepID=A0A928VNN5_9CYAN|nr:resolvase [Romeriopsis navalis LEGE 11480]
MHFPEATPEKSSGLMDIDDVQRALNRSRASVYRYANTDPDEVNPPYNAKQLNAELRTAETDPLRFHPNEVARFAKDILRIRQVTIEVQNAPPDKTQQILLDILAELKSIKGLLDDHTEF